MSVFAVVFVVLLILKLTGTIAVSWWLVALPLIIEAVLDLAALALFGGVAALVVKKSRRP